MPEELKPLPCPFCGGTSPAVHRTGSYMTCASCLADGPLIDDVGTALEAWNRRAQPERAAPAEPAPGWCKYCRQYTIAEPLDAAPSVAPEPPTREVLAEIVRSHLTSTYHCTRVWTAWHVGTMTEDDFEPASESDMAEDIADAILAAHPPRAPLTAAEIDKAISTSRDALLDHIFEHGTTAEGIASRFREVARAIEAAHGISAAAIGADGGGRGKA